MQNGVSHGASPAHANPRAVARDARDAILVAEQAIAEVLDVGPDASASGLPRPDHNAFGEALVVLLPADPVTRVRRAAAALASGKRVALLASTRDLLAARDELRDIAAQRLGAVFHAVETHGSEDALALAELGWGILFASDVEESLDLTLVARRAAEDSGTPFFVVHDLAHVRRVEPLAALDASFVEAYVGRSSARIKAASDPAHPAHAQVSPQAFAERVPFALASALRDLESITSRKRDVLTRSNPGEGADAALMLVGLGSLGDLLLGEVRRLRAQGHDVGAVKLTAFRPFPGPRAVRVLARSHAVTVLEHTDVQLAQSSPLARELKAAFSDAITWAPGYPGVGRVPRVHVGVVRDQVHDVEGHDVDAIVKNMLEADQGKRAFVLGGDPAQALPEARAVLGASVAASPAFHMRGVVRDVALASASAELATAVIAGVLALKVRATIRPLDAHEGGGFAFDLVASADRPRGAHLASAYSLLVIEEIATLLQGNPLARLGTEGSLAVPSRRPEADAVWGDLPSYAKAIVFDRRAQVVGWDAAADGSPEERRWCTAAAFVGLALGALALPVNGQAHVDPSLVERETTASAAARGSLDAGSATRAGAAARRAFEAAVVVPRAVVVADEASVALGRQDPRAAAVL